MDLNAGWSELCQFLNQPIPEQEYPRALVTLEKSNGQRSWE